MKIASTTFIRLVATLPLFAVGLLAPSAPARAAEAGQWHYDISLNLFMAGLSGNLAAHGVPVDVDAGFDDIVSNLEFSAAGRLTASRDRWVLSTELSYLGAGGEGTLAKADLKQWLVEPTVGYQFSDAFTGFAGVRYQSVKTDVRGKGPLGLNTGQTQDWFDPIVGFTVKMPLGAKWTFDGRFDVGGFGVGSDLTWQIFPYFNCRLNDRTSLQLGWRWLATDYEDGSGTSLFRYDVMLQGPQAGITFSF